MISSIVVILINMCCAPNHKISLSTDEFQTNLDPSATLVNPPQDNEKHLLSLVNQSKSILRSKQFRKNLLSFSNTYKEIKISEKTGSVSIKTLLDSLELNNPAAPELRWSSVNVDVFGPSKREDYWWGGFANPRNAFAGPAGRDNNGVQTGFIAIAQMHLERYKSSNLVEKSCAINTMSHEISHTLSDDKNDYRSFLVDTGQNNSSHSKIAIATYLIGSVAQCTFLESAGRIRSDEIKECVATFRVTEFNGHGCNDFAPGARVHRGGLQNP